MHDCDWDRDRFAIDTLFRSLGWRIHSRPTGKEARWEKNGEVLRESSLAIRVDPAKLAEAQAREDAWWERSAA